MTVAALLDAIKENRTVFGASSVLKMLKSGEIEAVYLSSNCPEHIRGQIESLAQITNTPVNILKENNEELAILFKKPFSISVASIRKMKEKE